MPIHQVVGVDVPIVGQIREGGAAGDEGWIDVQIGGARIPVFLQFEEALALDLAGPASDGPENLRMILGRDSQASGYGFCETASAAFGKMLWQ